MFTKERDDAMKERPRRKVANESDEVADFRIKDAQSRRGIGLRVRRIGKIADRLKADHRCDFVATRFASAGVNETSHLIGQKIRRVLNYKSDQGRHGVWGSPAKQPTPRKGGSP